MTGRESIQVPMMLKPQYWPAGGQAAWAPAKRATVATRTARSLAIVSTCERSVTESLRERKALGISGLELRTV